MLSDITKLNIQEYIKKAKKKDRKHINATTVDEYVRNHYECKDINYGSCKVIKIIIK